MKKQKTGVKLLVYFKTGHTGGFKLRFFGKEPQQLIRARKQLQKWRGKYDTAIIYSMATDQPLDKYVENQQH